MAHGTSIRIEKRQFRPGAGENNRRSQPSNPLHSADRECWDQLRGTARHYSRRLQQLVLGRLKCPHRRVIMPVRPIASRPIRLQNVANMSVITMVTSTITAPRWSRPKLAASISVSHRCSIARSEYEAEITGARRPQYIQKFQRGIREFGRCGDSVDG